MDMNIEQDIDLTKKELRQNILNKLKQQTQQQRDSKSILIENRLFEQEEFVKAKRIMFYLSFDGEVKTENMINKAIDLGKETFVPLCDAKEITLKPCAFGKDTALVEGPYHIREPKTKISISADKLDLVIVPALAFDASGNRLGRGKGYYDRFLRGLATQARSIGLAFDFQILPSLPTDTNDVPVDKVLSA